MPELATGGELSEEQLKKVEEFIEEEEGRFNRHGGWLAKFLTAVAVASSAFHLYAAYSIVRTDWLREIHVGIVLFLSFMLFPIAKRYRHRLMWWDVVCALLAVVVIVYMVWSGDDFMDRTTNPTALDMFFGIALMALVIEAVRRTTGWVMPTIIGGFLVYSGAGRFFLDFSFALLGGKPTSAGRAVVLASFLLGGPSGSGVATTVTIGTVAYPMLKKSGYAKEAAGGLLAAGGLGAILSPPVLGAAAFIIAEYLNISYLEVIKMATIPTILYYFSLFLMVELDARKYGMSE